MSMFRRGSAVFAGSPISGVLDWLSQPVTVWSRWHRRLVLIGCLVASFLVFVLLAYGYGPAETPDGRRDHAIGVLLVESGFQLDWDGEQFATLRREFQMVQAPIQYLFYHVVLGVTHLIAGENWLYLIVLFNVLLQTAITGALLLFAVHHFKSRGVFLGMAAMSMGCWEYLQWVPHSQSEPLFGVVVIAAMILVVCQWTAVGRRDAIVFATGAVLVAVASFFIRPTAAPLIVFVLISIVLGLLVTDKDMNDRVQFLSRWLIVLTLALLAAIPVLVFPLFDPSVLPAGAIQDSVSGYHDYAAMGMVVWERPEYTFDPPEDYLGFLLIAVRRLYYFFLFVAKDFSTLHKVLNVLFFIPFYALVCFGIWLVLRPATALAPPHRLIGLLAIGLILLFDVFHAVTLLDFDWRYRSPTYPAMFMLAAIGLETLAASHRMLRSADNLEAGDK